jgi:hypothetical protein
VFTNKYRFLSIKTIVLSLLLIFINLGILGCSDRLEAATGKNILPGGEKVISENLLEVAPPKIIQKLRLSLDQYQPQVKIISPQKDEVVKDPTVQVKLQVQDLPLFKNPDLEMGPHLHVILDNEPYRAVYDVTQPVVFENLSPGTHTLRVFASRPWHESFKNEGAYAQTTFHVVTRTASNNPDPSQPLLTYSRPQGNYGAEPIMLDFYLTNAPLHLVARENSQDQIEDWRIRVSINGQSFLLDRWQPIYLKGFKPGKNWIQLEFIDEQGNPVNNVFNNTVRLINYEPNGSDTLSRIVRGELTLEQVKGIVDPNYSGIVTETPAPVIESEIIEEPETSITTETEQIEEVETSVTEPEIIEEPQTSVIEPEIIEEPQASIPEPELIEEPQTSVIEPELIEEPQTSVIEPELIEETETSLSGSETKEQTPPSVIESEITENPSEQEEILSSDNPKTDNDSSITQEKSVSDETSPLMRSLSNWFSRFQKNEP